MAVYKVIQDIEAEDKILGPLTLRSFIYAAIAGVLIFISARLAIAAAPIYIKLIVILILLFPIILFGTLAAPLGRDQPTEVWLLSHIRFWLKPRDRIWNSAGQASNVTITAPKTVVRQLTKGFSQTEVQSRLQALATTLDSHGWVVKNSAVNMTNQPDYLDNADAGESDRLIGASSVAQPGPMIDVHASDDIMDEQNNATAQKFDQMMQDAENQRKREAIEKMNEVRRKAEEEARRKAEEEATLKAEAAAQQKAEDEAASQRAMEEDRYLAAQTKNHPHPATPITTSARPEPIRAPRTPAEEALAADAKRLLERQHKRLEEIHRKTAGWHPKHARTETVTQTNRAAKLELAQSGNDLSVATIAQLANRPGRPSPSGKGEVVVSLH